MSGQAAAAACDRTRSSALSPRARIAYE